MVTTQNFLLEHYDSFLFAELILFDFSLIRDHVLLHVVWWTVKCSLICRLSALLLRLPFLYIHLTRCLLLCVNSPVGGQHLSQPWLWTNEEHECTAALFIPEFLLGSHGWSTHSNTNSVPGDSLSRLPRMFSVRAAPQRQLHVFGLICCSFWDFITDFNL